MSDVKSSTEVKIPLEIIKEVFEQVFGSKNYFQIEIPKEYNRDIDDGFGQKYSKYDRCTAGYESNSHFSIVMGQLYTIIDASVDDNTKADHMKSLMRQFFYPFLRDLNDDMFDMIDKELNKLNK